MAEQFVFSPASLSQSHGRLAIAGAGGSGKTYTGLIIASVLAGDGKVAVIDSEHGSALKYADEFEFDHLPLGAPYAPARFVAAIRAAEQAGYTALLVDSISHEWQGSGGVQEIVDAASAKMGGNSWAGWSVGTPEHNKFLEGILSVKTHIICTMRAKTEWSVEERNGKKKPVKIGLAPIQRDGIEYEFDVVLMMDQNNNATVSKSRCRSIQVSSVIEKPNLEFATLYRDWLNKGQPTPSAAPPTTAVAEPAPPPVETPQQTVIGDAPTNGTGAVTLSVRERFNELIAVLQHEFPDHASLADFDNSWRNIAEDRSAKFFNKSLDNLTDEELMDLGGKLQTTLETLRSR